jgi:hypothetical protein
MPQKVTHKLEKVVSMKILKNDYNRLVQDSRDKYSEKIIDKPTISSLLRHITSHYLDKAQSSPANSGEVFYVFPNDTRVANFGGQSSPANSGEVFYVFPNDTRVANFGGQSSQVGFEQVPQFLPDGVNVYRVGGQPSPASSGEVIQVLPDGTSLVRVPCSYRYSE